MYNQSETDLVIDMEPDLQDEYGYLIDVVKRKIKETVEKTPRETRKKIWVEGNTIHWKVQRASSGGVILGGYKDWVKKSMPLPQGVISEELVVISKLYGAGKLTEYEFKRSKEIILNQELG